MAELDIVIPVYNEGRNIVATLAALARAVKTPARVLICYDHAEDELPAIRSNPAAHAGLPVEFVRNPGCGAHSAVVTGFAASTAPFILIYPADDDYNAGRLDAMVARAREGCDIVCASRFMPGGEMVGCPWLKAALVRSGNFTLHHFARLPTTDASNGFRLFSRRVIERIAMQSDQGFCYSIELLVCTASAGKSARCRCSGSSGGMVPAGSAYSNGCRPICAGTPTRSPLPCCGGRPGPLS
jgi:glycosyltransferase involved in cell wall biosynthesis